MKTERTEQQVKEHIEKFLTPTPKSQYNYSNDADQREAGFDEDDYR